MAQLFMQRACLNYCGPEIKSGGSNMSRLAGRHGPVI